MVYYRTLTGSHILCDLSNYRLPLEWTRSISVQPVFSCRCILIANTISLLCNWNRSMSVTHRCWVWGRAWGSVVAGHAITSRSAKPMSVLYFLARPIGFVVRRHILMQRRRHCRPTRAFWSSSVTVCRAAQWGSCMALCSQRPTAPRWAIPAVFC